MAYGLLPSREAALEVSLGRPASRLLPYFR